MNPPLALMLMETQCLEDNRGSVWRESSAVTYWRVSLPLSPSLDKPKVGSIYLKSSISVISRLFSLTTFHYIFKLKKLPIF